MKHSISLMTLTTIGLLTFSPLASAEDEYNVSNGLTNGGNPLGIHGTDPVALLNTGKEAKGFDKYAVVYDGVEYYFLSESAQKAFEADPEAYLPEYGGFCILGVALSHKKLDGDTRYLDIVDGKVYLFVNEAVIETYKEDKYGMIAKADEIWEEIKHTPVEDL